MLIIEDDKDIGELLMIIFNEEGYRVTLHNLAQSPMIIYQLAADIIIMDIHLAGSKCNGDELCKEFISQYPDSKTPVMLLSAEIDGKFLASRCGASDFLQKPFDIDCLLQRVSALIF